MSQIPPPDIAMLGLYISMGEQQTQGGEFIYSKTLKVTTRPGDSKHTPMIRFSGEYLNKNNFPPNATFEMKVTKGKIILTTKNQNKENKNGN